MKKLPIILLLLLPIVYTACKKDSNDPSIDKSQIVRKWQIDKYYGKGVDSTQYFNLAYGNYEIDVKLDGKYQERYTPVFSSLKVVNGTWAFIETNSTYLQLLDSAQNRTFLVVSLGSSQAKLKNPNADKQYWIKPKQ